MEQLDFIINGGETVRFHTWPVLRPQTVAEHSFHVAMLVSLMAGYDAPGLSVPVLMAALTHDLAEHKTGDLPAPVKRAVGEALGIPGFRAAWNAHEESLLREVELDWEDKLSPMESHWLKLADAMQGALYCIRERMMGNKLIATPFTNFRSYIRNLETDLMPEQPKVTDIINYIDDMWEQANG